MKLLFVDTETGGLEPGKHSLLEVALGVWEEGEITKTRNLPLVHDTYHVTQKALEINKIDLREPREGLYTPDAARMIITEFIQDNFDGDKAVLVGQNIHFDIGFLTELFTKPVYEELFSHRTIDTASVLRFMNMAGIVDTGGSGLSDAIKAFNIEIPEEDRHTALGDIKATAAVFNKLLEAGVKE